MSAEPTQGSANNDTNLGNEDTPTLTAQKAVTIFDEPEHIPPDQLQPIDACSSSKIHRASISGKKMTGRPPIQQDLSSPSLSRQVSSLRLDGRASPDVISPAETPPIQNDAQRLLAQVNNWLSEEKARRDGQINGSQDPLQGNIISQGGSGQDLALDKLEKILSGFSAGALSTPQTTEHKPKKSLSQSGLRRGSIAKAFKRSSVAQASSDTEYVGEDVNVPYVEASLDNTRTLALTNNSGGDGDGSEAVKQMDLKCWEQFKQDIVRLTHTLKLRGWRRIPIEKGEVIHVERLSGALTNAVYVVKPPQELPEPNENSNTKPYVSKSKPIELLLRVYGPQAEHLIDRDIELGILRRLARKKIGPRLLGCFTNGRFEEYLHAKTLTAEDIRVPATMKQIAKRMRELHEGIDLLPSEREDGAKTFGNWDSRVERCEKVANFLDLQVRKQAEGLEPVSKRYTRIGYVCGVEWPVFRKAYDQYRKLLVAECGGIKSIQRRMVFAHNDAQYGNLMKLDPPGDSPLLQPANQHRQLVVIDFEYAGPSVPGYEFANHFSEWCYNYHHADTSYACNTNYYPTRQEQHLFLRAYVMHRPQYTASASSTPKMEARDKTNISDFMLDARTPLWASTPDYDEEERAREAKVESDVQLLLREIRLWRIANAAEWVAWGIVQANVPEVDEHRKKSKTERVTAALDKVRDKLYPQSDPLDSDVQEKKEASKQDRPEGREQEDAHAEGEVESRGQEEEDTEEFDYLRYAQDRAMFFWGDCLQMGVVNKDDLPESLLKQLKIVDY